MELSYPQLTHAIEGYFKKHHNPWLPSGELYDAAFGDQDKVRFQLCLSNMALRPPYVVVKKPNPHGRGFLWKLREPDDPPFSEPPKKPRNKLAAVAQEEKPHHQPATVAKTASEPVLAPPKPEVAAPAPVAIPAAGEAKAEPPAQAEVQPVEGVEAATATVATEATVEPAKDERPLVRVRRGPYSTASTQRPIKRVEVGSLAAPAPAPGQPIPSKIPHREFGTVAETPPEIRKDEPDTVPVKHRTLVEPPADSIMASAIKQAFQRQDTRPFAQPIIKKKGETVAAFAKAKTLDYEIPPNVKVEELPRGLSSGSNKGQGEVTLPKFELHATMEPEKLPEDSYAEGIARAEAEELNQEPHAETIARHPVPSAATASALPQEEPAPPLPQASAPHDALRAEAAAVEETRPEAAAKKAVERRQEVRVRHVVETPSPTIGGLLDTLFGMIGPAIKVVLKEALVEAITSPQVKEVLHEIRPAPPSPRHATQEEDAVAVAPAAASVPDGSPPRGVPAPKHKPVMPGELHEVERLPKVTVIGLAKPKQEWDIKEEFKNQFDIRTVHTDVSARVVRKYSAGSAHVLLVVDHINHNMQHGLLAGGIAFERIGGGVAKVRERLKELVAQYQPEAAHA